MVGGFFEVEYQFKLRDMFSKEADKIIAKFDKVRDAATRANTRFTELAKNVKASSDNLKDLSHGIKPVNQGLKTMDQSAKAVTASVKAQNQALKAQSAALRAARASMVDYNRMAGVMMQAGQGLFRTGNMLGLTVTAPIVAAAFAGGKKFIGREERATQVRKTAGLSKENATYLIKLANKYSGRNPTSTEEMLDIAGILGQAGFGSDTRAGTEDLMTKSITVAKMMAAFDMTSEQAGTTFSKLYKNTENLMNKNKDSRLYGKFSDQYFNRLLDFVDLLENTSPVRASEIFEAMKTRTLASGLMIPGGMDPFETAAITTQMLRYKSPSRGSNIISQLLKNFADPEKVGDKLFKQFRDKPFETLIEFFDVMKGTTTNKAYDMAAAVNKSYSGELTSVAAFEKEIRQYAKEAERLKALAEQERITGNIQKGGLMYGNIRYGLDESYRLKVDTFLGKLQTLKNNIDNALANFFTRIEPTLSRFIDRITPKVRAFSEAIERMPEKQLWIIITGLTTLALLAPSLMILGTFLNSISAIMKSIATVKSGIFITIFKEIETFIFRMLGLGSLLGVGAGAGATGASVAGSRMVGIGGAGIKALGIGGASNLVGVGAAGLGLRGLGSVKTGVGGIGALSPQVLAVAQAAKNVGGARNLPGGLGVLVDILGSPFTAVGGGLSKLVNSTFGKTANVIGKSFARVNIIGSILEGAITGQWLKALLGGAGGWLGGALGGAALGTLGGGPIGTLLGALGGGILGTEMGKGVASGVKKLFPDIDDSFIQSLRLIINLVRVIFKVIGDIANSTANFFSSMFINIDKFAEKHPKIKGFLEMINNILSDATRHLRDLNNQIEIFLGLREGKKDKPKTKINPVMYQGTWYYTYEDLEERVGRDKVTQTLADIRNAPTVPSSDMTKPTIILKVQDGRNPTLTNTKTGESTVIRPGANLPFKIGP